MADSQLRDFESQTKQTLAKLETRSGLAGMYLGSHADEEYNPGQPNDFEKIVARRTQLKKEIELKLVRERELKKHLEE